jgi:hypothetical protein
MHDSTRATVGGATVIAVAAASIWLVTRPHDRPPPPPVPPHPMIAPAPPEPEPAPVAAAPEPDPEVPTVVAGDVELDWLPAGYVRDIPPAKTAELVAYLQSWITSNGAWPHVTYRSGVIFARSTEDRGDDGPYPRSAQPQALHVCGVPVTWLRDSLRDELKISEITCAKNVCAFGGMEYAPRNYIVFHEADGEWTLDAWASVFYATLSDATRAKNYSDVAHALEHLRGATCAGEPAGAY